MTFAPPTLTALMSLWTSHGGVNLGIVGDTSHIARGTSYHLGKDNLIAGAYSAKLPRDVAGLSNAASAVDFGKVNASLTGLQKFSVWLVAATRANPTKYRDIREIIFSPDGKVVRRWDNELHALRIGGDGTGQGDNTHLWHTHISFYRDSEFRDKRPMLAPYWVVTHVDPPIGEKMGVHIEAQGTKIANPLDAYARGVIKGTNHEIFRVADTTPVHVTDGLDLGVVERAKFVAPLPGWADGNADCVVFNYGTGGQHVAVIRDVALTPLMPDPIATARASGAKAVKDAVTSAAVSSARSQGA